MARDKYKRTPEEITEAAGGMKVHEADLGALHVDSLSTIREAMVALCEVVA